MELAQTLVRSVARSFYETRKYLIVDALVIHSALRDDDLAYLMSMNTKDLHRMCGELRNHRMLAQHTRAEQREGQQRPNNRIYYYIDYRQAIDAIKWRTLQLSKSNQETIVPASERKEYFCGRCKAEWTQMEVLDNVSPMGFRCHNCNFVLTHDPERNSTGHERSSRMNNQLKFITDLLPRIDSVRIPDNNFDVALERAVPVVRDATHQVAAAVAVESHKPTAVKGMTNVGLLALQVNISQSDGPTEAEKEAERVQKEKVAQQNALPSWMSNSTITGESFSRSANTTESFATSESKPKPESTQNHAAVEDLFSQLQAETAAQEDEEYGSDDEEFEDVPVATPLSTLGAPGGSALVAPSPLRHSMSGTNTGANSPGGGTPGSEERSAKRVKLEVPHAEESEEEFEFEDV